MMPPETMVDEPFEIDLPCIRVKQPMGEFFLAAIDSRKLCEITYADVREMYGDREVDTYLGIQREVNQKRVKELKEYVTTADACFPTAIILAVSKDCAEYDSKRNLLKLRSHQDQQDPSKNVNRLQIAKVLDGQHRIEGLRGRPAGEFDVNVSVFIDMDIENQAYLFSIVNLAQTKVNRSLVYDLFEYARARSPQKTCHNIAVALDAAERSPFFKRIKRLGVATEGRFNETLTQATFVQSLIRYLTKDQIKDRDIYLRGSTPPKASAEELRTVIFRNMFIAEQDIQIADIVFNYFSAVQERWPGAWNHLGRGRMLNKTNGFSALMRVLRPAYLHISSPGEIPSKDEFLKLFARSPLKDEEFDVDRFKPGTSGETALYSALMEQLRLNR